jgi:hypothetical protein
MGPVPVVMAGVLAEKRPQVSFIVDEHPVGAFGSCGAYPPLGIAVRTCRVATSMTNRMYRRLRKIVSTVKKSQASSPCA